MDLCDINQIKALLAAHGFHFSKAKGQNFLTQGWVPARIAEESGANPDAGVLEVGPGIGCLTKELCLRAGKVCAVEVDTSLKPILAQTLGEFDNLSIVYGDVLKLDLEKLVSEQFPDKKPMACANLPYYITSPILSALLESRLFSQVTVMVQKEVAQRICAPAGHSEYSAFSVFCQYYSEPELLFDVPPHCFIPQPKVTSSVIRLTMREEPLCELLSEAYFFPHCPWRLRHAKKDRLQFPGQRLPQAGQDRHCRGAGSLRPCTHGSLRDHGHPRLCCHRQ